jgi:subtilisin family serine protease
MAGNSLGTLGSGAGARIMALKAFYNPGTPRAGSGSEVAIVKSIDYAIANNARVLNLSLGARLPRSAGEQSIMKQAMIRAKNAGLILVVAAGNDGLSNDLPEESTFPAGYTDLDNLIAVAASDENDNLAKFSNYGVKSVHIAAPGTKILSTVPNGYSQTVAEFTDDEGRRRTIYWNGTSMAAPMVAGVVAQVWAKNPKFTYKQVIQKVLSTARKVPNLEGRIQTGGIVDMEAALK